MKFSNQIKRRALIVTGPCANALRELLFNDLNFSSFLLNLLEWPLVKEIWWINKQNFRLRWDLTISKIVFLFLMTMNSVILGKHFFKEHYITINSKNNLAQLTDLTVQLNQVLPEKGKKRYYRKKLPKIVLILAKKVQIAPQSQVLLECSLATLSDQYQFSTGLVIPSHRLEDKCRIALTSSLSEIDDAGKVFISAINLSDDQITLNNKTETPYFEILNEAQADYLI